MTDDLISRQALDEIKELMTDINGNTVYAVKMSDIRHLPSVNPQEPKYCDRNICVSNEYNDIGCDECEVTKSQEPKTGHWIEKDGFDGDVYYDCSECGESWSTIEGTPWDNEWNYCPSCGCRMVEPKGSDNCNQFSQG